MKKIDRILVISPLNAFDSWKREFKSVFGNKKILKSIDTQTSKDFKYDLTINWGVSNLILVNYESLPKFFKVLDNNIDNKTMLVFDEVHRIKKPEGKRAEKALLISKKPKFKYVLTGTPIPNSYKDIYNFLNILYGNEYNSFFEWDLSFLSNKNIKIKHINEINKKIHPFFWRTNKIDLGVPDADDDLVNKVSPNKEQLLLAKYIYKNEKSSLAILIRLIQASTNPELVTKKIDFNELMSYDIDDEIYSITEKEFNNKLGMDNTSEKLYDEIDVKNIKSPKFNLGIEIVQKLVSEGKKVLVWGILVDTLYKIKKALDGKGIKVNLVYGQTEKSERSRLIDEFRDGDIQVLVSNPQTLGESISLHNTVHDAVYFEYNFNLTFMLQSRDRIHRLGLEKNQYTRYHYLQTASESLGSIIPGYIDEKIYYRLKEKEQLMYEAIDDKTLSIEYSENEIEDAIKIIDKERCRINKNNE